MSAIDSFFALMRQSIIDSAPTGTLGIYREAQDNAKAEVDALRQRVEDLELMLRCAIQSHPCWEITDLPMKWSLHGVNLADDGTGLPILTPEAREELRKR